jgi:hypothetical protein
MSIVKFCAVTSLAVGLPLAAIAQQNGGAASPSDIRYCHTLSHAYSYMWPNTEGMPVGEAFSLGQCDTDTLRTIASLEKKMKDLKIELPPREGVAQAPGSTEEPCRGPTAVACTDGVP